MRVSKATAKKLVEISRKHKIKPTVMAEIRKLILQDKYWNYAAEIDQILGKALGYPFYASDQKNFPGATEADGVCTGDNVPESLALEAARNLVRMGKGLRALRHVCSMLAIEAALGDYSGPSELKPARDTR